MILITLLLRTELRLCQMTIFIYTRWPFLASPSAPSGRPRTAVELRALDRGYAKAGRLM